MSPPGPVTLRPTGPGDIEAILAMEADPDTRPWLGESSPSWHAAADMEHLVALHDGEMVGFAVLAGPRGTETGTELRRLVVARPYRGRGLGRVLLRAVLDHVGPRRVWLDVRPGNERARALYESEGFVYESGLPPLLVLARDHSAGSSGRPS